MYIYLLLALLAMAPFFGLLPGSSSKRNGKGKQSGHKDRQISGGALESGRQDLCEVSGYDHRFRPLLPLFSSACR